MMANMGDKLEKSEVCDDLYSDARPGYFSRHGKCGALLHHDGSDLADILCGGRPDLHKKGFISITGSIKESFPTLEALFSLFSNRFF